MKSLLCCTVCNSNMESNRRSLKLQSFDFSVVNSWMKIPNLLDDHHAEYLEACKKIARPTPKKTRELIIQSDKFPIQVIKR